MQRIMGAQELGEDRDSVKDGQYHHREPSEAVTAELPPHQLPLSGPVESLFSADASLTRLSHCGWACCLLYHAHAASTPPKRMRGSDKARRMSERSPPIEVSTPMITM